MKTIVLAVAAFAASGVIGVSPAATLYDEPYRLQYHFSPAKTWTNDPNGPVWYKGEFHLFFQDNPFGSKWGHMSWGHAVSKDLLHWKELPVAIPEENGIMIFSGSVVIDYANSSGLCDNPDANNKTAPDKSCLIAIYTGHTPTLQTQNIAYSNDRGRRWIKYKGNPVIDLHMKDFRDPKVVWMGEKEKWPWVMAVSLPNDHKVRFFGSRNLLQWTMLSDFGPAGATGGQWECPDLFRLAADAKSTETKWVLVVNINPGGQAGGSATQYFVGQFDGKTFKNENPASTTLWFDWGKDNYAGTSFFNAPPGDPGHYFIGWFSNWEYAADEPTSPQRGAMTLPRELLLRKKPEGTRLIQVPVNSVPLLRGTELNMHDRDIASANKDILASGLTGHEMEIMAVFEPGTAQEFGVIVHKGQNERTVVGVTRQGQMFIDRTHSGDVAFSPKFPGRHDGPIRMGKTVALRIFLDRSSVEVFGQDGETVISDRVFPAESSNGIELYTQGGQAKLAYLRMWKLNRVW